MTTGTAVTRDRLRRYALALAWATVAWNVVEAVVAILAGSAAGSVALVSFGLDSTIEVGSAAVIIWQFSGADEERERLALRFIAFCFFALGAYVGVRTVVDLAAANEPESSPVGIVLAVLSLIVMPTLAVAKARVGNASDRRPSPQTAVRHGCAHTSRRFFSWAFCSTHPWDGGGPIRSLAW